MWRGAVGVTGCAVFFVLLALAGVISTEFLPAPWAIGDALLDMLVSDEFWLNAASTLLSWLIALGIAVVIGVPLGVLLGAIPWVRDLLTILIEAVRTIPATAIAIPVAMVLGGSGATLKIALAAFVAMWPTVLHAESGVQQMSDVHRETAAVYGDHGWRTILMVHLPSIAPTTLTGVRLSASIALVVVVTTEFQFGGGLGIGQYASLASGSGRRLEVALAAALIPAAIGCVFNMFMLSMQRRLAPWAPTGGAA